ncbi:MAG: PilN domain-containing protein [Nitrosomonas sp.]|nr:PilN domain-containing protein [Nitrosomonas sp.]MDP1950194.1 PilN domain-containing protein [Nitrosomonas sp.]
MIRINLLPHRELKRKEKLKQVYVLAVITCIIGIMIVWAGNVAITDKITYQNTRNLYLNNQIAVLDKQIAEIREIKAQTQELLLRKGVVETLQSSRAEVVHLLDQLVRLLPDGVYLQRIKQEGHNINLVGFAQSNAWVSTLMRNLDSSPWLESPLLIEIKAITVNNTRLNEFSLNVKLIPSFVYDSGASSISLTEDTKG